MNFRFREIFGYNAMKTVISLYLLSRLSSHCVGMHYANIKVTFLSYDGSCDLKEEEDDLMHITEITWCDFV